jgi:DEAD/DEAH box helicase domain-containing protein
LRPPLGDIALTCIFDYLHPAEGFTTTFWEDLRVDVEELVKRIAAGSTRAERMRHLQVTPERAASYEEWPDWLDAEVQLAFERRGIQAPYRHQRAAADDANNGHHLVLSTGTASGKSLAYLMPTLTAIRRLRNPRGVRGASVLYLTPTKALAADQLHAIQALKLDVRAATVDSDSSSEQRDWARAFAEYVLTNPDLLHHSLLPAHKRWASFLGSLAYVVVDECHQYRGVFGAHVAQVLRRLQRICAHYGADPTFILTSATMAEPQQTARQLTGKTCRPITDDSSPRGRLGVVLWEPPVSSYLGEHGAPLRRAVTYEAADLLADLVLEKVATLAFVRSRRGVELLATTAQDLVGEVAPELRPRVAAYRGGYLPEERRELEEALREQRLLGVAATNALELGIDVAGLDAVIVAGFPGTRAALWQQWGRAGRAGTDALGILIAGDDPLDSYLVDHPELLLGTPVEACVFDPDNKYVLAPHLCAAAAELPITEADFARFGPQAQSVTDELSKAGLLRRRPRGWFWTDRRRASELADLRSAGGGQIQLIDHQTGRVVGTVDAARAHSTAHPGAVYLHRGETWLVQDLDLEGQVATMDQEQPNFSTHAREVTQISISAERDHHFLHGHRISFGEVVVTHQVVSYLRKRLGTGEVMGETSLDLPPRKLTTQAVWWSISQRRLGSLQPKRIPGAAHAAEHCSIGLLPLFATCDRWDIGGVSTARHADTGMLTVFVYDGHPGGAGFAERGYTQFAQWLRATQAVIAHCECLAGCPSCVQSPKCGNRNQPLDKSGALDLLELLLGPGAG